MKIKFFSFIIVLFLIILSGCSTVKIPDSEESNDEVNVDNETKNIQMIEDTGFSNGFGILGLNSAIDGNSIKTEIKLNRFSPVWKIGQWGSKYDLNKTDLKTVTVDKMVLKDASKEVILNRKTKELTLSLDATKEYEEMESSRVMWTHLLIEQEFDDSKRIFLDKFESLNSSIEFNIFNLEKGKIEKNSNENTLPVQFLQFYYVVNYNKSSKGFGSFLWFGLYYFDSRYAITTTTYSQDFAGGTTGNYIYSVGMNEFIKDDSFVINNKYKLDINILPYIETALLIANEKGFIVDTKLEDCVLTGMNLGYESPGAWKSSVSIENLSLLGNLKKE